MVKEIRSFLSKNSKILDIGSGTCNICEVLRKNGHDVTPLDIQNLSFTDSIRPILYDGIKIPFDDDKFDISLIITVLHHTAEPDKILEEAARVSKQIIIIEDIYTNVIHKYLTYFFDSLLNLEFVGHPHTNKSDKQWKVTFNELGLKLIDV
ncbi:MAG: class I SAM-dependent methyltransferase, partial [bacterium]